jgi:hypothetical protein
MRRATIVGRGILSEGERYAGELASGEWLLRERRRRPLDPVEIVRSKLRGLGIGGATVARRSGVARRVRASGLSNKAFACIPGSHLVDDVEGPIISKEV